MSKITVKQAAYWLSEAWGRNVPPNRCRLRGNWLFVYTVPFTTDIDCIYAGGARFGRLNVSGEPWTEINWEDSPFNPKWDKSILEKLDAEIKNTKKKLNYET